MNKEMKHIVLVAIILLVAAPCFGQSSKERPQGEPKHPQITEVLSDLSSSQKRRLEAINKDSKGRIDGLRSRLQSVRDSVRMYMEREGDYSKELFPLFDREAELQRSISREMYTTKVRIDEVLTKEQRAELRKANQQKGRRHERGKK